jgi:hypothetical protein
MKGVKGMKRMKGRPEPSSIARAAVGGRQIDGG